jgi:hypothetical protein
VKDCKPKRERKRVLSEVRERKRETSPWALGLAIGLGATSLLGVIGVLVYLLSRRRADPQQPLLSGTPAPIYVQAPQPQVVIVEKRKKKKRLLAPVIDDEAEAGEAVPYVKRDSGFKTVTLPAPGADPTCLYRSRGYSVDVTVRAVSPPAQFATLAHNAVELQGGAAVPIGNTFVLATGSQMVIRLRPDQYLYARGSVAGVVLSYAAYEATGHQEP